MAAAMVSFAAHNHEILMRDLFTEIFENQPLDPTEAARRGARPQLRRRFYARAQSGEAGEGGFPVLLDGKLVRTPAGRSLATPAPGLAEAVAAEWEAQKETIDPARMPLTRLANAVIDAVGEKPRAVAEEIEKYLDSDLLLYRAETPEELAARQSASWDPVLAWARDRYGAHFVTVVGITHTRQPAEAIALMRAIVPSEPWRLGALSSITSLTGSALLGLALAQGELDAEATWAAAHVDEDWQMERWGSDTLTLAARDFRYADMQAAAAVLRLMPSSPG
jgi:chaperone required for assembly of F1-ATPase